MASPASDKSAAVASDVELQAAEEEATKKATAPSPTPGRAAAGAQNHQLGGRHTMRWPGIGTRSVKAPGKAGALSFYSSGYADLIARIRALAENLDIPADTRAPLIQALENHERHVSTRKKVEGWLTAVERHMDRRDYLEDAADRLDMPVAQAQEYPDWKREAVRLTAVGKDILSDTKNLRRPSRQHHARRDAHAVGTLRPWRCEPGDRRGTHRTTSPPSRQSSRTATGDTGTNWRKMRAWGPVPSSVRTPAVRSRRTLPMARVWKGRSSGCAAPSDGKPGKTA